MIFIQPPSGKALDDQTGVALLSLQLVCKKLKISFEIAYGPVGGMWRIKAGFLKSRDRDFVKAVSQLIKQILDAKKVKVEDLINSDDFYERSEY